MAGIFINGCSPSQRTIDPKNVIVLSIATNSTSLQAEFRWKISDTASWSAAVAGTTTTTYNLPANTWSRDKFYSWQCRYRDSAGWSDWATLSVDTSGWDSLLQYSSVETITLGSLGEPAGAYVGRVVARDGAGITWGASVSKAFNIHDTRSLIKLSDGRWKGVPIQVVVAGSWKATSASP